MKRKLLFVYVFIAFVLVCNSVYATITMDMALDADKTTVKPGDTIAVTVKLKNISDSISSIEAGFIDVDESIVGSFSSEMIAKNSNGKIEVKSGSTTNELSFAVDPTAPDADYDVIFNTKNTSALNGHDCRFLMDLKQDIKGDAEVLGLNLTVKETATIKDVKDVVKVNLAEVFSEKGDVTPVNATLDVKVEKADEPEAPVNNTVNENKVNENTNKAQEPAADTNTNKNVNKENTNTNKNTNTNSNTNKNTNQNVNNTNKNTNKAVNNTNSDGTVSSSRLPSAGARMLIIPVIVCAILGYVSYIKYLKYKDI